MTIARFWTQSRAGDGPFSDWSEGGDGLTAPANTVAPVVSGSTPIGSTLSTTDGTWTGNPVPTFTYQWTRDNVNISGATSSTYVTTNDDAETDIRSKVTGTNSEGSATATSSNSITVDAQLDPEAPVTEVVNLAPHGATYDITEVNSVSAGNFWMIVGTITGLTFTGSLTNPRLGVRVSTDGGSTWLSTAIYSRAKTQGGGTPGTTAFEDKNEAPLKDTPVTAECDCIFWARNMNAAAPVTIHGVEMFIRAGNSARYVTVVDQIVPVDALQVGIYTDSGTAEITAGTLRLEGYR